MKKCDYCGISKFKCSICGKVVLLEDVIDIFHIGTCNSCGSVDEPCKSRVEKK